MHVSHDTVVVEWEIFEVRYQPYPTRFFLLNTLHTKDRAIRGCGFLRSTFNWLLLLSWVKDHKDVEILFLSSLRDILSDIVLIEATITQNDNEWQRKRITSSNRLGIQYCVCVSHKICHGLIRTLWSGMLESKLTHHKSSSFIGLRGTFFERLK